MADDSNGTLIFYDTRGKDGKGAPSPNTGKTYLALRHKQLPFETRYLSYPDIAPYLKSKSVPAAPGEEVDWYTLPAIEHKGSIVMGSKNIAKYLEKAFPDNPRLYPGSSEALASTIEEHLTSVRHFALYRLVYHKILESLDEAGEDYYRRTRTEMFGPSINERPSAEEEEQIWKKVPEKTAYLGQLLQENEGPFLQGHDRSYADLILVASLRARQQWDPSILQRILTIEPVFARLYKACDDILDINEDQIC